MCRLIAYLGQELLMEEVLIKPTNSLVKQSLHAKETSVITHGDGFGLGWYVPNISTEPVLFTSIFPAWNDRNLLALAAKIQAPAFFAHIRSASSYANGITHYNCHPFVYGPWMFMHNGSIEPFVAIKRPLQALLDDDLYQWIQGETDSEHIFALFLQLAKGRDLSKLTIVADVLENTFRTIIELMHQFNKSSVSMFNVCLTDGYRLLVSRYTNRKNALPETMHYSLGNRFVKSKTQKHRHMLNNCHQQNRCIVVSSEKLTRFNTEWQDLLPNHLLMCDDNFDTHLRPLRL